MLRRHPHGCEIHLVVLWLQDGKAFGDEYLAELDLIEVVERYKDNYESDVEDPEQSCAGSSSVSDEDVRGDKDSDRFVAPACRLSVHCV